MKYGLAIFLVLLSHVSLAPRDAAAQDAEARASALLLDASAASVAVESDDASRAADAHLRINHLRRQGHRRIFPGIALMGFSGASAMMLGVLVMISCGWHGDGERCGPNRLGTALLSTFAATFIGGLSLVISGVSRKVEARQIRATLGVGGGSLSLVF